jgi:hypothetical protein
MFVIKNKDSKRFMSHGSNESTYNIKHAEIFVWFSEALRYLEKNKYNIKYNEIIEVEIKLK